MRPACGVVIGLVLMCACGVAVYAGADEKLPADRLYSQALSRERALRSAAPISPKTLTDLRHAVTAYEQIVRLHPRSGYSDNALWQASGLALEAYQRFRQAPDLEAGLRLLETLFTQYPASSLGDRVPDRIRQFEKLRRTVRVTAIRRQVLPEVVRVTVELDGEAGFHFGELTNPARVFFDLHGTAAESPLRDATLAFEGDAVREIRLGRHPNQTTRIVLDTTDIARHRVFTLYDPFRIVIDCERRRPLMADRSLELVPLPAQSVFSLPRTIAPPRIVGRSLIAPRAQGEPNNATDEPDDAREATTGPVELAPPQVNSTGAFSLARQLGLGISRIVIDPGHGGHDPGARAAGLVEAALVLDIARRLERRLLASQQFEVVLTRRGDEYVSLEERTGMANRTGADLFLSVHANASRDRRARGVETYFLDFATDSDAQALAARENAVSADNMRNLPAIVRTITTNTKVDESREFAQVVQAALIDHLRPLNPNVQNLGVKQAPFVVLIGTGMPSILAEVSFLTNGDEARLLASDAYRDRIADALFEGILQYQRALKTRERVAWQTSERGPFR